MFYQLNDKKERGSLFLTCCNDRSSSLYVSVICKDETRPLWIVTVCGPGLDKKYWTAVKIPVSCFKARSKVGPAFAQNSCFSVKMCLKFSHYSGNANGPLLDLSSNDTGPPDLGPDHLSKYRTDLHHYFYDNVQNLN